MVKWSSRWFCLGMLVQVWGVVAGNAVAMEFVTVGDPGNAANAIGVGSVDHVFRMGKYEVTVEQYAEFLNAVAKDDRNGLYYPTMEFGGINIVRMGETGTYRYAWNSENALSPMRWISFPQAVRFANWMHNGQPEGPQNASTTEDGAYTISPDAWENNSIQREPTARYFLPSTDEWFKAAYYKGGNLDAGYWMYPTQSDDPPQAEVPPGGINSANYDGVFGSRATFVGSYTNAPSPYGTFDQAGNVFEWTDTAFMGGRGSHGGYFGTRVSNLEALSSSHTSFVYPLDYNGGTGFRIAMIPEPTTIGLLIAATMGLLAIRRQGSRQAMGHVAR